MIHGCGPLLVLAGAGSGKTRVLTHRIAHMVQAGLGPDAPAAWPTQILAVTFTNKASREMRERIATLIGEEAAKQLWMGTFHSICVRLLRRDIVHYEEAGGKRWDRNFVIYDETDANALIKDVVKAQGLDDKLYPARSIKHQISELKNAGIDCYQYASNAKDFQSERLAQLYDAYQAGLSQNNALDFDDLLLVMSRLLQQHPQLLSNYHQHFRHLLVDEFQDTNQVQYELVRLLATGLVTHPQGSATQALDFTNRSFTVVGDVDQSIYSWRGANFRILLNFQQQFPTAHLIKLQENYRSTGTILKAANTVIENNTERLPKELKSVKGMGQPIFCYEAADERDEASYVVDKLLQQARHMGKTPNHCCVLYRTNVQSRALEEYLMARGIPYAMVGGLKFYERKEVKDVLAYLTVLFNPADSYRIQRVLNVPKRSIGKKSIEVLEDTASRLGISLFDALKRVHEVPDVKGKAAQGVAQFVQLIERLQTQLAQGARVDELMLALRDISAYDTYLMEDDPATAEERLANLDELVSVARRFYEEQPEGSLGDFLAQMALLSDLDTADSAADKAERLTLMTMHSAKGLEFPLVAVVGLEEGMFPHSRSLANDDQMEEERRLMYVAVTRAEEYLLLSFARRRLVFGDIKYSTPSRFLKEIPPECLTGNFCLDREETGGGRYNRWREGGTGLAADESAGTGRTFGRKSGSSDARKGPAPVEKGYTSTPVWDDSPGKLRVSNKAETLVRQISSRPEPTASVGPLYAVGDKVRHAKFGEGTVAQVLGEGSKVLYNVQFEKLSGKKLIDPRFAPLELL